MRLLATILFTSVITTIVAQPSFDGIKKINGSDIRMRIEGKGEYLLLIHGGPGLNYSYFRPFLDILTPYYTLVYYDQRASGKSSIPSPDSISLKYFTEDIEGIRKVLGVEKLNILAHSWGSIPATNYCIAYPQHVGKLIYCNPAPLSKEYEPLMLKFTQEHTSKQDSTTRALILGSQDFSLESVTELMKISLRASAYDRKRIDDLNLNLPHNFGVASQALYAGLGKELSAYNWYPDVKKFKFPTLIIEGKYDGIPTSSLRRLNQSIPNSKLVILEKSGHFPFLEETKEFAEVVKSFLK